MTAQFTAYIDMATNNNSKKPREHAKLNKMAHF